jgi:hypothetical protein
MESEWILVRLAWGLWIRFDCLRTGTGGGLLWVRWWTFGFLRHGVSLLMLKLMANCLFPSETVSSQHVSNSALKRPNVMVEWLTRMLRIREVLGLNLDLETSFPEVFVLFLSPSRQMSE